MIISRIHLYNYGPYAGEHTFDLSITPDRPIILVSGDNGYGKTTLFQSITLCLHGRRPEYTQKDYEERLRRLVHRYDSNGMAPGLRRTSIQVIIRLSLEGELAEYKIQRSWGGAKSGIYEKLDVWKLSDDEYVVPDSIDTDQLQNFVNGLIPPGIADLFFVDGAKVESMKEKESREIHGAFTSLLGLDTVERLRRDLDVILRRMLTTHDNRMRHELERLDTEKAYAEKAAARIADARTRHLSEKNHIQHDVQAAEARVQELGGGYAEKRQMYGEQLASLRVESDMLARCISSLCAAELPFGLIPQQLGDIQKQMDIDAAKVQSAAQARIVSCILDDVQAAIKSHDIRGATDTILDVICSFIPTDKSGPEVLALSTVQQGRICAIIDKALGATQDEAGTISERYAGIRKEMGRLQDMLERAPADDEIGPLVSKVKELHTAAGRIDAETEHLDMEASRQEALIRNIKARIREKLQQKYKNKKDRRAADLAQAVQNTLEEYARRLRTAKVHILEEHIAGAARTLLHKENFISGISIDVETFEVTIRDTRGDVIPRESISSGEKRMVAISILWGLARASGRLLPFMIDAPMTHLDEQHRSNLANQFFPMASHQTLLFSTPTEMPPEDHMDRYLSRTYTLYHDPATAGTVVLKGYPGSDDEVS